MKKLITLLMIVPVLVLAMIIATSCTKEGEQGPKGEDGINGTDGTATCGQCHDNTEFLYARITQWEKSGHAAGMTYERNGGECAICHTSQGFKGNLDGSYDYEAEGASIANPNPVNCYTCHNIHTDYTTDDYGFVVTEAPALRNVTGEIFDFGNGNTCANCHQGRTVDPFPVAGGDDVTFTTSRYGVHHGPQANTVAGLGLFEIGTVTSAHQHQNVENTCAGCHMQDPYGGQAGGHTFSMTYTYHGSDAVWVEGCLGCHVEGDDALHTKTEELMAEIEAQLLVLKALLDEAGITEPGSDSSVGGTYPAEVAGACLNYKAITEDRSLGVHNPNYIRTLLANSIAALQ